MVAPPKALGRQNGQFLGSSFVCAVHGQAFDGTLAGAKYPMARSYLVAGEIPRFVSHSTYTAGFGSQWRRYRVTQLDLYAGTPIAEDRLGRLGYDLWNIIEGPQMPEAGRAGLFTEYFLARKATGTSVTPRSERNS